MNEIPAGGPLPPPSGAPANPGRGWFILYRRRLRAALIWGGFFGVLYWLQSFFSLIFLTFIASYTINSLVRNLCVRLPWPRGGVVILVYTVLLVMIGGVGMILIPKVYQEGKEMSREIPDAKEKLLRSVKGFMEDPEYARFFEGAGLEDNFKEYFSGAVGRVSVFLQALARTSFHFLLSIIFSFLIIWDLDRLLREMRGLEYTRLRVIYRVLGRRLIHYGDILGKAFEAQIIIAMVNTFLTLLGLTFLGIPSKLFLSVFVFLCSFIPVLGVIMSSIPICLLAYKSDGVILAAYGAVLISIIHFFEAYFLNPRIVGAHLRLHPFVAVSILVMSEYFFGVWGLLLGVPTSVFVFQSFIELHPRSTPEPMPEKIVLPSILPIG